MSRVTISLCFVFLSFFSIQAQNHNTKIPENSTLSFRDWAIVSKNNVYQIEYRKNTSPEVPFELHTGPFLYQDSNGRTVHIQLQDNIAVGDWQYYSSTFNGPIINSRVSFVAGYKHGTEVVYSYDRVEGEARFASYISSWILYAMGNKKQEIKYWSNGQISSRYYYDIEGKAHGEFANYYKDGSIYYIGSYIHGKPDGVWKYFYKDGALRDKVKYTYPKGKLKKKAKAFYPNAQLRSIEKTKNNSYQAHYLELDIKGDTLEYHRYRNDVAIGKQINTQRKIQQQIHPVRVTYCTNHKGRIRGSYTQVFTENKQLRVEGVYNRKGERNGLWKYYLYDGRSYLKETYKNGVLVSQKKLLSYQELEQEGLYPEHHLEEFPSGKLVREKKEPKLFLFSE